MELVFSSAQGTWEDEIKRAIGFIDRSVKYENLERFLKNATRDLILTIGEETYGVLQLMYVGNDNADIDFIHAVQDCVSIEAYRRYAPSKDVGHTQDGRRMRLDEHEKQAFEWMIDRDNENMERMYYQSLDQLLELLDDLDSWKLTDQYKKLNELFVNKTADVQDYFNINNSRLLLLKLQPGIRQCERQAILPRLTKLEFDALKADATGKEELLALVKEACVYWALSWAMRGRLTVTLFPEGVLQRFVGERMTTKGKQAAQFNEFAWAGERFRSDAEEVLRRIEESVAPEEEVVEGEEIIIDPLLSFDDEDTFVSS